MHLELTKQKKEYLLLSCTTRAILFGSLLGDGSLKIHKGYKNARFSFRHSIKQKDYFIWKRNQLATQISSTKDMWEQLSTAPRIPSVPTVPISSSESYSSNPSPTEGLTLKLRYQSKALPSLTYLYYLVRKKKKFCIKRKWLNMMDPLSLAIWWCDDGSLVKNTKQGVFCTDGFLYKDVQVLQKYMIKVWKIQTKIYSLNKFKQDKNERFRLWITSTSELKKFLRIIIPYIPVSSMLYKVIILYKNDTLQQRWISEIAENSKIPLDEIQELVIKRKSELKAFSEKDLVQKANKTNL